LLAIPFLFNNYIRVIAGGFIGRILNYYKRRIFDNFITLNIKILDNLAGYIFKAFNRAALQITANFKGKGLDLAEGERYRNYNI